MKKNYATFYLLICLFATSLSQAQTGNYQNGDTVDDFTVTDTDGVVHNLYSYTSQGKYVFLDFFFADCVPCQGSSPTWNEFYDKYGCNAPDGQIINISINNGFDDNARVIQYENQYGGPFNHSPAVSNEGGGEAVDNNFGVSAYPTFCLIGPDNKMINRDIWPLSGIQTFENAMPSTVTLIPTQCTPLSISDSQAFNFTLYPTVSNGGNVFIILNQTEKSDVTIYDMLGKQVYSNNFTQRNVEMNLNLSAGNYLVKVNTESGTSTERLIIK